MVDASFALGTPGRGQGPVSQTDPVLECSLVVHVPRITCTLVVWIRNKIQPVTRGVQGGETGEVERV